MKKAFCGIVSLVFICALGFGQEVRDLFPQQPGSLTCWTETRATPRPLKIHYLKVSLKSPDLEVLTLTGEDPDGDGPAESQLTQPEDLFRKFHALAAVNANAYAGLGGDIKDLPAWLAGHPVDIHGLTVAKGKTVSPIESTRTSFWLDAARNPHIGNPSPTEVVVEAVSDWFSPLIIDSRIIPDAADTALHPRTALGFDKSGSWLLFIVIDGRQPGISEGASLFELAQIFQEQRCAQSLNLDGGGSSILLIQEPGSDARTVNSPSGKAHRPIPVMLGVRKSE
jgi:hypothetical protein